MIQDALINLAIYAFPVFLTLTLPLALQARIAYKLGDTSQRFTGRLSWDPVRHTDWLGTVALPAFCLLFSGAAKTGLIIGWGKPLDINPAPFKKLYRDLFLVESPVIFGPLLLALLWAWLAKVGLGFDIEEAYFYRVCQAGQMVGLVFFAFAMLPLPPFPLGNALLRFLPAQILYKILPILPYVPFIILGLAMLGVLGPWIRMFALLGGGLINLLT